MAFYEIPHESEQAATILTALRARFMASCKVLTTRRTVWQKNEELFVGYVPEKAVDAARRLNRENGSPEYTTIQLPYSYAVAMAAHSYWTSVFLARTPVLQFSGTSGESENQVLALETLLQYQVNKARMLAVMYIWLQDAPKYGEAWVCNYWKQEISRIAEFVEVEEEYLPGLPTGKKVRKKRIREGISYEGNSIHNVHPADVFTDPRYPRNRFQEGEFVATRTTISMLQLKEGKAQGRFFNIEHVKKTPGSNLEFATGAARGDTLDRPSVEDLSMTKDKTNSDVFEVLEFIIKIIPKDWGLGAGQLPEKWVFSVTHNFQTIFEARPFGAMHNKFPLALLEIEPEAYLRFSRSLLEIYSPLQDTLDWLVNSHFYNVRQVLNNQFLFDPSLIYESDVQNPRPGKAIRLKPAAYGSDVRRALTQLPTQDVTQAHMSDMRLMYDLGARLGVGDSVQGIQTPASRRTTSEVRGSQAFSVGRLKTIAEYFSVTGFFDLASMMVSNSQQYYTGEKKLAIVGDAAILAGERFLTVTPDSIMGEYSFVPVDGVMPIDRFAQANLWRETITQMAQVPQVMSRYDLGKIFGYVAQLMGIKNLERFAVQVVPDAAALANAQAGNIIPMDRRSAGDIAALGAGGEAY